MADRFLFHHAFSSALDANAMQSLWQTLQRHQIMPCRFTASELIFFYHQSELECGPHTLHGTAHGEHAHPPVQARLLVEAKPYTEAQLHTLYEWVNRLPVSACFFLAALHDEADTWVFELAQPCEDQIDINALSNALEAEVNLLNGALPTLREPGVLLMDMDSTAIQIECIDEIAKLAGVGDEVAEVTELAMQGKLDFEASLRKRVATLKGAPATILDDVLQHLPLTQGLTTLVNACQQAGWKVGIASGGFTFFAHQLQQCLGLDEAQANTLVIDGDTLAGQVDGPVVDAAFKANLLDTMCQQYRIPRSQSVAIGDGANDLPMLAEAALGVAFHAKPVVAKQACAAVRRGGLQQVLPMLRCC